MTKNADLLSDDHDELDGLLEAVFDSLDRSRTAELYSALDLFWARLAMHIRAEHLHLFPAVEKAGPAVIGVTEKLRADHNSYMKLLAEAIKLSRHVGDMGDDALGRVRQIVGTLKESLAEHNRIEESDIYPLADLGGDLGAAVKKELDNIPPRFRN